MASRVGCYLLFETLGEGAFGKVKLGVHEENGEQVAVKIMDKSDIKAQEMTLNVRREIAIMKALKHRNIVNLRQVLTSHTKLYIVMDLVTGGELFTKILKEGKLPEDTARHYFQQLVDGIEYCHKRGVCHRDLKPENLLIDETTGELKITDFGLSAMKGASTTEELLHTQCGSPNYCAPEIISCHKEGYNGNKVDAWSCGIILFALLAGYLPFYDENTKVLYRMIQREEVKFPKKFPTAAKDLILRLLHKDPEKRFTLQDVKKHSWFLVGYTNTDAINSGTGSTSPNHSGRRSKPRGRHARKRSVDQVPRMRDAPRKKSVDKSEESSSYPPHHVRPAAPPPTMGPPPPSHPAPPALIDAPRYISSSRRPPAQPAAHQHPGSRAVKGSVPPPPVPPPSVSPPPPPPPPAPPSVYDARHSKTSTATPPAPSYPIPPYAPGGDVSHNRERSSRSRENSHLSSSSPASEKLADGSHVPRFPPPPPSSKPPSSTTSLPPHTASGSSGDIPTVHDSPDGPSTLPLPQLLQVQMENSLDTLPTSSTRKDSNEAKQQQQQQPVRATTRHNWTKTPPPPSYAPASNTPKGEDGKSGGIVGNGLGDRAPSSSLHGLNMEGSSIVERRKLMYGNKGRDGDDSTPFRNIYKAESGSAVKRAEHGTVSGQSKGRSTASSDSTDSNNASSGVAVAPRDRASASIATIDKKNDEIAAVDDNPPVKERLAAAVTRYRKIFRLGGHIGITASPSFQSNKKLFADSKSSDDVDDQQKTHKHSHTHVDFFSRAKAITGAWGIILSQELDEDSDSEDERPIVTEAELKAFQRLLDFWDNRRASANVNGSSAGKEVLLDDEKSSPLSEEDISNIQSLLVKLEPKPVEDEMKEVDADAMSSSTRHSAKSVVKDDSLDDLKVDTIDIGDLQDSRNSGVTSTTTDEVEGDTTGGNIDREDSAQTNNSAMTGMSGTDGGSFNTKSDLPPNSSTSISAAVPPPPAVPAAPSANSDTTPPPPVPHLPTPLPALTRTVAPLPEMKGDSSPSKDDDEEPDETTTNDGKDDYNNNSNAPVADESGENVTVAKHNDSNATKKDPESDHRMVLSPSTLRDPIRPSVPPVYPIGERDDDKSGNGNGDFDAMIGSKRMDSTDRVSRNNSNSKHDSTRLSGPKRKSSANALENKGSSSMGTRGGGMKVGELRKGVMGRESGRMLSGGGVSGSGHDGVGVGLLSHHLNSGSGSGKRRIHHSRAWSRDDHSTRGLFAFNMFNRRKSIAMTSFDTDLAPDDCLMEIGKILVSLGCHVVVKKGENKMKCEAPIKHETLKITITCTLENDVSKVHLKKGRRDKSQVEAKEFYEFFQVVHARFHERVETFDANNNNTMNDNSNPQQRQQHLRSSSNS